MTTRYYRVYNNGVAYCFTTPDELATFAKEKKITTVEFSIVDVHKISETCNKETEIICITATF